MDVDKTCDWLRSNHVWEITSSQKDLNYEALWAINFCTDNEQLVSNLQKRCSDLHNKYKEKTDEALKQKDKRIEHLINQLDGLHQKFGDLQSKLVKQSSAIVGLEDEKKRLMRENASLGQLKSDNQSLKRAYQNKNSDLIEVRKDLKRLRQRSTSFTDETEIVDEKEAINSRVYIPLDVCIVCGKPAMLGQGQCLDCAR
ncbi:hypothetical protein JOY44_03235 [Phormidium sp. CLA17]|uniref:hypothetical protein n=1 Tax=Leptolyngbya sp. Cla-17 TaxID=2803751 RepID=UPI0019320F6B|nr:hypothetical protein [Leptolyngbya sp. Cla-17]MBM0740639.1 hypothetical protein [Leptolyngbya sp. Cla-17]